MEILDLVAKHDPIVKERLSHGPRNAKIHLPYDPEQHHCCHGYSIKEEDLQFCTRGRVFLTSQSTTSMSHNTLWLHLVLPTSLNIFTS